MSGSGISPILQAALGADGQAAGAQAQGNIFLQLLARIVVTLEGQTIGSLLTPQPFTGPGALTITAQSGFFSIRKTTPAATVVNLPAGGGPYIIADGAGNAASDNITITPAAGYTINGSSTFVMSTNWQAIGIALDGTNYLVWS